MFFGGLKYLNSLMRIRDPGWRQFGSGIRDGKKVGSGIKILCSDPNWARIWNTDPINTCICGIVLRHFETISLLKCHYLCSVLSCVLIENDFFSWDQFFYRLCYANLWNHLVFSGAPRMYLLYTELPVYDVFMWNYLLIPGMSVPDDWCEAGGQWHNSHEHTQLKPSRVRQRGILENYSSFCYA